MLKNSLLLYVLLLFVQCKSEKKEIQSDIVTNNYVVQTLNYKELKPLLERKDHKNYVVNFWATWCAPCVKELPYFEELEAEFKDRNIEVLLVSLDFPNKKDTKLLPFLKQRNIKSKVILLDDANEDVWIQAIDESWSGAIPATLFYNSTNRKFFEQSFTRETLYKELQTFLNL